MGKLKVFEAFSGYGSQRMALRNLGINFESVGISEIDIHAILSYASIHDGLNEEDDAFVYPTKEEMIKFLEDRNIGLDFKTKKVKLPKNLTKLQQLYRAVILSKCFGDVCLLNSQDLPDMDLFTYSFPCTDISVAGQQQGVVKGQTRSGLLYECEKIIEVKRPKYLLLENVKNLVGKKFKWQFDEWLQYLESLGYTNYWEVLNAKDYGVPQNRERVFVVSILNNEDNAYTFPKKEELNIRLKYVLEPQVEDKYYLSEEVQARFKPNDKFKDMSSNIVGTTAPDFRTIGQSDQCYHENAIVGSILARDYKQPKQIISKVEPIGYLPYTDDGKIHQSNTVYNKMHISPTLNACDYKSPIKITEDSVEFIVGSTQDTASNRNIASNYRIRKLTPLEYWRLMGCSDDDFYKAKQFNSDSQLYKQAGNSIVVSVLEGIFANLF